MDDGREHLQENGGTGRHLMYMGVRLTQFWLVNMFDKNLLLAVLLSVKHEVRMCLYNAGNGK